MNTYIDESGTFVSPAPRGSWSVVAALATPEHSRRHIASLLEDLRSRAGVPGWKEIKLADIPEDLYANFLARLARLDVALFAVAKDCGLADPEAIKRHQQNQVQRIRDYLPKMLYEGGRLGVAEMANAVEALSPQLYVQMVCQTELIHDVLGRGLLYFVQRIPQTLRVLRWRIDEKNSARPSFERTFQLLAPGLLQSKSLTRPLIQVEGLDYSFFKHYEHPPDTVPTHLTLPSGESVTEGLDLKRMLNENLRFADSKNEHGIQVVDLLVSGLRRLLRGNFSRNDRIAKSLGSMTISNKKGNHSINLISLDGRRTAEPYVAETVRTFDKCSKYILSHACSTQRR